MQGLIISIITIQLSTKAFVDICRLKTVSNIVLKNEYIKLGDLTTFLTKSFVILAVYIGVRIMQMFLKQVI